MLLGETTPDSRMASTCDGSRRWSRKTPDHLSFYAERSDLLRFAAIMYTTRVRARFTGPRTEFGFGKAGVPLRDLTEQNWTVNPSYSRIPAAHLIVSDLPCSSVNSQRPGLCSEPKTLFHDGAVRSCASAGPQQNRRWSPTHPQLHSGVLFQQTQSC